MKNEYVRKLLFFYRLLTKVSTYQIPTPDNSFKNHMKNATLKARKDANELTRANYIKFLKHILARGTTDWTDGDKTKLLARMTTLINNDFFKNVLMEVNNKKLSTTHDIFSIDDAYNLINDIKKNGEDLLSQLTDEDEKHFILDKMDQITQANANAPLHSLSTIARHTHVQPQEYADHLRLMAAKIGNAVSHIIHTKQPNQHEYQILLNLLNASIQKYQMISPNYVTDLDLSNISVYIKNRAIIHFSIGKLLNQDPNNLLASIRSFESAIHDLTKSIPTPEERSEDDSRLIAEYYFELGSLYKLAGDRCVPQNNPNDALNYYIKSMHACLHDTTKDDKHLESFLILSKQVKKIVAHVAVELSNPSNGDEFFLDAIRLLKKSIYIEKYIQQILIDRYSLRYAASQKILASHQNNLASAYSYYAALLWKNNEFSKSVLNSRLAVNTYTEIFDPFKDANYLYSHQLHYVLSSYSHCLQLINNHQFIEAAKHFREAKKIFAMIPPNLLASNENYAARADSMMESSSRKFSNQATILIQENKFLEAESILRMLANHLDPQTVNEYVEKDMAAIQISIADRLLKQSPFDSKQFITRYHDATTRVHQLQHTYAEDSEQYKKFEKLGFDYTLQLASHINTLGEKLLLSPENSHQAKNLFKLAKKELMSIKVTANNEAALTQMD